MKINWKSIAVSSAAALALGAVVTWAAQTNYIGTVFIADSSTITRQMAVNVDGSINATVVSGGGVPSIAGTANQITQTGSPGATTLSIPSDFRPPGTVNKVTITQPVSGATLTLPDGTTLNGGAGGTLASGAFTATGTSGATIPLLNGTNTWSGVQTFNLDTVVASTTDAASATGGSLKTAGGASVAKRFWIPAITASAGLQTAVLCQSSGGEMIADSIACLASSARFKTLLGSVPNGALQKLAALPIRRWAYKPEGILSRYDWTRERIGPIAEDVARMDERLVGYDDAGRVRSISTEQLLAYSIKAIQELKAQNDQMRRRLDVIDGLSVAR